MPQIITAEQQSDEWWAARLGVPTASSFSKILTATGKRSEQRKDYLYTLAGEIITGQREEGFSNWTTDQGHEREPEAVSAYELLNNCDVERVGFALSDCGRFGASPDGKRADCNIGLEIKCKTLKVAVKYLDKGGLPTEFKPQVQGQILTWGFEGVDFFSYYPGLRPLQIRIDPDPDYLRLQREALEEFCSDLAALVERLR